MPYMPPSGPAHPNDEMFPRLTPAQQARIAARAVVREVQGGEILVEPDDKGDKVFVVVKGHLNILDAVPRRTHVRWMTNHGEAFSVGKRRPLKRSRATTKGVTVDSDCDGCKAEREGKC